MIVKGVRAYFYVCQKMTSRSLYRSISVAIVLGVLQFCT